MKTPHQLRVESFMRRGGQVVRNRPSEPTTAERALRARLILEEALETVHALGFNIMITGHDVLVKGVRTSVTPFEPGLLEVTGHFPGFNLLRTIDGCCDLKVVTTGTLSACGIVDEPMQEIVDAANLRKFGPGGSVRPDGKIIKPPDFVGPEKELQEEIERQIKIP